MLISSLDASSPGISLLAALRGHTLGAMTLMLIATDVIVCIVHVEFGLRTHLIFVQSPLRPLCPLQIKKNSFKSWLVQM